MAATFALAEIGRATGGDGGQHRNATYLLLPRGVVADATTSASIRVTFAHISHKSSECFYKCLLFINAFLLDGRVFTSGTEELGCRRRDQAIVLPIDDAPVAPLRSMAAALYILPLSAAPQSNRQPALAFAQACRNHCEPRDRDCMESLSLNVS